MIPRGSFGAAAAIPFSLYDESSGLGVEEHEWSEDGIAELLVTLPFGAATVVLRALDPAYDGREVILESNEGASFNPAASGGTKVRFAVNNGVTTLADLLQLLAEFEWDGPAQVEVVSVDGPDDAPLTDADDFDGYYFDGDGATTDELLVQVPPEDPGDGPTGYGPAVIERIAERGKGNYEYRPAESETQHEGVIDLITAVSGCVEDRKWDRIAVAGFTPIEIAAEVLAAAQATPIHSEVRTMATDSLSAGAVSQGAAEKIAAEVPDPSSALIAIQESIDALAQLTEAISGLLHLNGKIDKISYDENGLLIYARVRQFANAGALAAAVGVDPADGAEGEVHRFRVTAVGGGGGMLRYQIAQEL